MTGARRALVAWLPAVAYMLLIWWLSSEVRDLGSMPHMPLRDKFLHAVEYGVLALLVSYAVGKTFRRSAGASTSVAALVAMGWGLLDEWHQAFVPGRTADFWDLLADASGALLAALLYIAWRRGRAPQVEAGA